MRRVGLRSFLCELFFSVWSWADYSELIGSWSTEWILNWDTRTTNLDLWERRACRVRRSTLYLRLPVKIQRSWKGIAFLLLRRMEIREILSLVSSGVFHVFVWARTGD